MHISPRIYSQFFFDLFYLVTSIQIQIHTQIKKLISFQLCSFKHHTKIPTTTTTIVNNPNKQTKTQKQNISARNAGYRLWPGVKIPHSIPRRRYNRLKGAYMGFNSFDDPMELWPKAHWGKFS